MVEASQGVKSPGTPLQAQQFPAAPNHSIGGSSDLPMEAKLLVLDCTGSWRCELGVVGNSGIERG